MISSHKHYPLLIRQTKARKVRELVQVHITSSEANSELAPSSLWTLGPRSSSIDHPILSLTRNPSPWQQCNFCPVTPSMVYLQVRNDKATTSFASPQLKALAILRGLYPPQFGNDWAGGKFSLLNSCDHQALVRKYPAFIYLENRRIIIILLQSVGSPRGFSSSR